MESEDRLLRQPDLKQTFYCSKECQKLDWKRHKKVCGHLALLGGLENDNNPSPWIHSYDIVFQDAALDKLKWTGPRSFAGLSDEAVRVFACSPELRGPNSTFSCVCSWPSIVTTENTL